MEVDEADLNELIVQLTQESNVSMLKKMCTTAGLPSDGRKQVLVHRYANHLMDKSVEDENDRRRERQQRLDGLANNLAQEGFVWKDESNKGDCFLDAVRSQYGHVLGQSLCPDFLETNDSFRQRIHDWLVSNQVVLQRRGVTVVDSNKTWEEYLQAILVPGTECDTPEVIAVVHLLKCSIRWISDNQSGSTYTRFCDCADADADKTLVLGYLPCNAAGQKGHWTATRPKRMNTHITDKQEGSGSGAPCSSRSVRDSEDDLQQVIVLSSDDEEVDQEDLATQISRMVHAGKSDKEIQVLSPLFLSSLSPSLSRSLACYPSPSRDPTISCPRSV